VMGLMRRRGRKRKGVALGCCNAEGARGWKVGWARLSRVGAPELVDGLLSQRTRTEASDDSPSCPVRATRSGAGDAESTCRCEGILLRDAERGRTPSILSPASSRCSKSNLGRKMMDERCRCASSVSGAARGLSAVGDFVAEEACETLIIGRLASDTESTDSIVRMACSDRPSRSFSGSAGTGSSCGSWCSAAVEDTDFIVSAIGDARPGAVPRLVCLLKLRDTALQHRDALRWINHRDPAARSVVILGLEARILQGWWCRRQRNRRR